MTFAKFLILGCVCLSVIGVAGCGPGNKEETSASYRQLSKSDAEKRLQETMDRRNGKLPPGALSSSGGGS
jgi:hypothetical protein